MRYNIDQGDKFDQREWAKDQPLSFLSLREKFVGSKEIKDISQKQMVHIEMVLILAGKKWDLMQIKDILEPEIDDFFDSLNITNKTKRNYLTVLHDFWVWVVRIEHRKSKVEMPEFPEIEFKLVWRNIIDIETRIIIIEEVKKISFDENPRIWLGVQLLSMYPKVRPRYLLQIDCFLHLSRIRNKSNKFKKIGVSLIDRGLFLVIQNYNNDKAKPVEKHRRKATEHIWKNLGSCKWNHVMSF